MIGRRSRAAAATAGIASLLLVVAAATRAGLTQAGGESRAPTAAFWDYAWSTGTIAVLVVAALVFYLVWNQPRMLASILVVRSMHTSKSTSLVAELLLATAVLAFVAALVVAGVRGSSSREAQADGVPLGGAVTATERRATAPASERHDPQFRWPVALLAAAVATGLAGGGLLAWRQRSSPRQPIDARLAEIVEDALDDLRAERDPRRAVIAAYANMERTLRAYGLPRRPAEAPFEYLERVLLELRATAPAVRRLTDLFERAKFSHHAIGAELKEEAIETLGAIRDQLRTPTVEEDAA